MGYEKLPALLSEYELPDSGLTIGERKALWKALEAVAVINSLVDSGEESWLLLPENVRGKIVTNAQEMQEGLERAEREGKLKRKRLN